MDDQQHPPSALLARPRPRECHDALFEEALVRRVLHAFRDVCAALGDGFSVATYTEALRVELAGRGFTTMRDVRADVRYGGVVVGTCTVALLVESRLAVELRSDREGAAERHLLSCLRATGLGMGVLLRPGSRPSHRVVVATPAGSAAHAGMRPGRQPYFQLRAVQSTLAGAVRESLRRHGPIGGDRRADQQP